MADKKTYLRNV